MGGMRVWLEQDEKWPVIEFKTEEPRPLGYKTSDGGWFWTSREVELPDELAVRYHAAKAEWDAVQDALTDMWHSWRVSVPPESEVSP